MGSEVADEEVSFETRTVRTVRGLESRTIAKCEDEGWEFVSQDQGPLRTELHFRRPKSKAPNMSHVLAGVAAFALVLAVIVLGVGTESDDQSETATPAVTSEATPTPTPSMATSKTSQSEDASTGSQVITVENNDDLASLLELSDYCAPSIEAFAEKYRDRTIAFEASIGAMNSHNGAKTRYDILIGAGTFSETSSPGPAFQFRDVNTVSDLNYKGDVPDSIGVGTNLHVEAEVEEYEAKSCLFLLDPVETVVHGKN